VAFVGVNGTGKTTTIGKVAYKFSQMGKKVLIVAGDTFRAAAIEQIAIWAERAGVAIVRAQPNSDPASVIYDGVSSAMAKDYDVVLIDTAGRQHTKENLMKELGKIDRSIKKLLPEAPHEAILVVDATTLAKTPYHKPRTLINPSSLPALPLPSTTARPRRNYLQSAA
jgi:fused signal recognition particle receptor